MKRKGGFYNYILVLPCVLLSCLTTILFWLPPESAAKMVLGMNIFTSFFVLLLLLSKNVPSSSDKIPVIGAYYCLNMVMIATSTCFCTGVVHIFYHGQGHVPFIIRKIFLEFLAGVLCMTNPPNLSSIAVKKYSKINNQTKFFNPKTFLNVQQLSQNHFNFKSKIPSNQCKKQFNELKALYDSFPVSSMSNMMSNLENTNNLYYLSNFEQEAENKSNNEELRRIFPLKQLSKDLRLSLSLIDKDIKEIRDFLRHTKKKIEATDSKLKQANEWKQVALVLDRVLFFIYITAIIVSFILMFPR